MRALVLYETMTGNTRLVGQLTAVELLAAGVPCTVIPVGDADQDAVDAADVVVVGTWTDGFLVFGQRPGRKGKLRRLPSLAGKRAVVYCTYAVNPGSTVDKLSRLVADLGAEVVAAMAVHRNRLGEGARELADRVLALPPPSPPGTSPERHTTDGAADADGTGGESAPSDTAVTEPDAVQS